MSGLPIWTIYERPADYPDLFVARLFIGGKPSAKALFGRTLDEVRAVLTHTYPGLFCIPRDPRDEPQIVETWL